MEVLDSIFGFVEQSLTAQNVGGRGEAEVL